MRRKGLSALLLLMGAVLLYMTAPALAAETAVGGGYLSGYAEVDPRPSATSWWSTLAYLVSLFAVFVFVVVMAYLASRFLSGHFGKAGAGEGGRILAHLPLGPNRSVCVVELAERIFMLGVTEHSITLLREVTDAAEIERLQRRALGNQGNVGALFSSQLGSFEQFARRIPSLFRGPRH